MVLINEKIYYVYNHIRLDTNEIFYVGIGTKNLKGKSFNEQYVRANFKSFSKRSSFWLNIYNKCGKKIEIVIVFETNDLKIVRSKEIELIKLYGKRIDSSGTLVNITDGGEGAHGSKWTDEQKEARGKLYSGVKNPFYNKKHSQEVITHLMEINLGIYDGEKNNFYGKTHSDKTKKIISDLGKKRAIEGNLPELHPQFGEDNHFSKKIIAIDHNTDNNYFINGGIKYFCDKHELSYGMCKKFKNKGNCYVSGNCKNFKTLNTINWEFLDVENDTEIGKYKNIINFKKED